MITFEGVGVRFADAPRPVLHEVDLVVPEGELALVVGRTGSGKTTLLRAAIGSVLTTHPRVLVLDEPTSALDPLAAEDVLATLQRLVHDLGMTVLLAEHRLERVAQYADRVVLVPGAGRRAPTAASSRGPWSRRSSTWSRRTATCRRCRASRPRSHGARWSR